jgi:hypothetical protein
VDRDKRKLTLLFDSFEVRVLLNEKTRGGLLYKPY